MQMDIHAEILDSSRFGIKGTCASRLGFTSVANLRINRTRGSSSGRQDEVIFQKPSFLWFLMSLAISRLN
jgi:hypothetical protein